MASKYPAELDGLSTTMEDRSDAKTGEHRGGPPGAGYHATAHNDAAAAINAIEGVLGLEPQGSSASVAARLLAMSTLLGEKVDAAAISAAVAAEEAARKTADATEKSAREAADGALTTAAASAQAVADAAVPKSGGTMTGLLTLSGDPTNALHAATRQFVLAQITALVNGAPGALDTLKEIAERLESDESLETALTNTVAGKLAAASNLSDLASASTARANLGLGSAATKAAGAAGEAGKVLAADDAVVVFSGDATGITDVGPALQEAFDHNTHVKLKPGGVYRINTPIFLDSTERRKMYVLEARGAEIVYGPGLPSASTLEGLAGTKWAFFVNTVRSALSAGVVTSTAAKRATGESVLPPAPRFQLVGGTHEAGENIVGLAYGNGASTHIKGGYWRNIQCGISWSGYVDENKVEDAQLNGASPTGGQPTRMIYQREAGDGTSVINTKAFGGVHLDIAGCLGFKASGCVSGQFILNGSKGVIDATHQETDEIATTPYSVFLNRTQLTMIGNRTNASKSASKCTIKIEDSADTSATQLHLIDHLEAYYLRPSGPTDASDPQRGPTIQIVSINNNGRIRATNSKSVLINGWTGTATRYAEGLYLASEVAGITTALGAGADILATGSFELSFNGIWLVTPPNGGAPAPKSVGAPTLSSVAEDTSGALGSLANGTTYQYVIAAKLADGRYTALSTAKSAAAGATGAIKLAITNPSTPCRIAVWRITGAAGVETTPDHYVELPMDGYNTTWFDTGARINGLPWQTAGIAEPAGVKGTGSQSNFVEAAGAVFQTFSRRTAAQSSAQIESAKPQCTLVEHPGGKVSRLVFRTGSTAAVGLNHAWKAIINLRGQVVAVTADHAEMKPSEELSWELAEALNLPPGLYYEVTFISAGTVPNILSSSGTGLGLSLSKPIFTGVSSTAGLTTPPAVGSVIAPPATSNGVVLWVAGM